MKEIWFIGYYQYTGLDYDYVTDRERIFYSEEDGKKALRRKHVTDNRPQYDLYVGYLNKNGILDSHERILVKDETGIFLP